MCVASRVIVSFVLVLIYVCMCMSVHARFFKGGFGAGCLLVTYNVLVRELLTLIDVYVCITLFYCVASPTCNITANCLIAV